MKLFRISHMWWCGTTFYFFSNKCTLSKFAHCSTLAIYGSAEILFKGPKQPEGYGLGAV